MNTLQLQLFVSITSTLNFSKTAKQFYITQPAVSHHVKMLENSLDVKLLRRNKHQVSLTDEGAAFLPYANHMLEISSNAHTRVQNMAQGRWGHISIAALSTTSYILRDCLVELYKQYPAIQADIDLLEGPTLLHSIQQGTHDFYFSLVDMISNNTDYKYSIINRDKYKLFVNKDIADSIDMSDWSTVERQPFVSVMESDVMITRRIKQICKERGFEPRIINHYNRAESVMLSVDAGLGVAILPGKIERLYHRPNVVTLPIEGDDVEQVYCFAWKLGRESNVCNAFRDVVLSLFPM